MKRISCILAIVGIILWIQIASAETQYSGQEWTLIIHDDPVIDPVTGITYIDQGISLALGMNGEQQARATKLSKQTTTTAEYYAYVYSDLFAVAPDWLKASWDQEVGVVSPSGTLIQPGCGPIQVTVSDDGRILSGGMTTEELFRADETCPFNTENRMQGKSQAGELGDKPISLFNRFPDLQSIKSDLFGEISMVSEFRGPKESWALQLEKTQLLANSMNT